MSDFERARALFLEGIARYQAADFAAAEGRFRQAEALAPGRPSVLSNLAVTLARLEKADEARQAAEQLLQIEPGNVEGLSVLGWVLQREGHVPAALAAFEKACELRPQDTQVWSNCASALRALKRFDEALERCERAIGLSRQNAMAWCNRGAVLNDLGRPEQALQSLDEALALEPQHIEACYNRANTLAALERHDEALAAYAEVQRIRPGHADAHFSEALLRLHLRDFEQGWPQYEWRWRSNEFVSPRPPADLPVWDGRALQGRLLVRAEQGVGDMILYAGMLGELQRRVADLAVTADARLLALLQRSFPDIAFITEAQVSGCGAVCQVSMGSLGLHLRPRLQDFPQPAAFLRADPGQAAARRTRLAKGRTLCGIAWASKNIRVGAQKTVALADLLPVFRLPGLSFVDLQYGDTAAERDALRRDAGIELQHVDDIDNFNDIDALAALISACDVVVTTSNVTVHLAAALGMRTFLLVPSRKGRIWYWHDGLAHSIWYPGISIHRQPAPGDWAPAIAAAAEELASN